MSSILPSTCCGTPVTILRGGVPSRSGHHFRTRAWLPPMPPEAITTACARSSNPRTTSRLEDTPRGASSDASTAPRTPVTVPASYVKPSTRCRKKNWTPPAEAAARALAANGSDTPVPVPQGTWKRGTELPWPPALPSPRSAQPTRGVNRMPCPCSQARFSPAANSTNARPHRCAHSSSGSGPDRRSHCADPCQSCQASSKESFTPRRRCIGVSTRKRPPSDQNACPPRLAGFSCSTMATRLPARTNSLLATRPARPPPMMMTSASIRSPFRLVPDPSDACVVNVESEPVQSG